jgi:transcriptional regulator with XRE-family HTH domain
VNSEVDMTHELAAFLRTRRERLNPDELALPASGRSRRTPGLRREEVAELAGVSVDYVIRLEQGRGLRPSSERCG